MKQRTDEHIAKNLSRMTREAEQRELRLRDDMEKLRTQQEQSLATLDTKIDAMMERRSKASGYHGQVGWATRQQEWTKRRGTELGRSQQGAEGELQ